MKAGRIAFVVEGANCEPKIVNNIKNLFHFYSILIIDLPLGNNIYNLYQCLKKDDFETDIIEIIREKGGKAAAQLKNLTRDDFQEIYLFFDFDIQEINHHTGWTEEHACAIVADMLCAFDNETETGKLYISYPMVEALVDTKKGCLPATGQCLYPVNHDDLKNYKKNVNNANPKCTNLSKYDEIRWRFICASFIQRCFCLMNIHDALSVRSYKKQHISPHKLFEKEQHFVLQHFQIFILSAFPEFLLDYFQESVLDKLWNNCIRKPKNQRKKVHELSA